MKALRYLFLPFAWAVATVIRLRHWCYDSGLRKHYVPTVPSIAVGNLSFGGTGKTPHVESIVRILHDNGIRPVAVLSRGYGRSDSAVLEVRVDDPPLLVGDEPLQMKQGMPDAHVFVAAERVKGFHAILVDVPDVKAVVMDDALQHRRVKAGLNILLTTFRNPYHRDHLFPVGSLRDIKQRAGAAQMVVVTKCPHDAELNDAVWRSELGLRQDQKLFFSKEHQLQPEWADPHRTDPIPTGSGTHAVLFTGIADAREMLAHCRSIWGTVRHVEFPDHHAFTQKDIARLAGLFDTFAAGRATLVTTAKDATRIRPLLPGGPMQDLPLVIMKVEARIVHRAEEFASIITTYVGTH